MPAKPVVTKQDFVRRYKAGEFGNASITWPTFHEYQRSNYEGLVHLRSRRVGGAGLYNCDREKAFKTYNELVESKAAKPEDIYVSAMAPHHLNVIQGEVFRGVKGLSLFYSQADNLPMRDALRKDGKQLYGIEPQMLLYELLPSRDMLWLLHLLDEYPGHVVEFSTFQKPWGTVPGYRTVYWEVRSY